MTAQREASVRFRSATLLVVYSFALLVSCTPTNPVGTSVDSQPVAGPQLGTMSGEGIVLSERVVLADVGPLREDFLRHRILGSDANAGESPGTTIPLSLAALNVGGEARTVRHTVPSKFGPLDVSMRVDSDGRILTIGAFRGNVPVFGIEYQWQVDGDRVLLSRETQHMFSAGSYLGMRVLQRETAPSVDVGREWASVPAQPNRAKVPRFMVPCAGGECVPAATAQEGEGACCFFALLGIVAAIVGEAVVSVGAVSACMAAVAATAGLALLGCLGLSATAAGGLAVISAAVDAYISCRERECPTVAVRLDHSPRPLLGDGAGKFEALFESLPLVALSV